jgi:UPF0755 protein
MMEWHDPFAADEADRERERRRAEREARRRERQQSLGDKVGAEDNADDAQPEEPAAAAPPSGPPRGATGTPAQPPPAQATAQPSRPQPPAQPPGGQGDPPSEGALWVRRVFGLGLVIVAVLLVFFAAKAVKSLLNGGGDDSAPAQTKVQPTQTITIPEGLDRSQIADLAKEEGIKGDYLKATKDAPKSFDLAEYDAKDAPDLEGFLFPDTWNDLPKQATVRDLVGRQLATFQDRIKGVDMSYAESKNLTVYDVLKIASMVEREIQVPEERKLAAAVIYNRLSAGDTLGIDATIRYHLQNYDEQLTQSELADPHPYNTRVVPGLPPTPIGNPGLDSIEAAANPAKSDAYFFVVKPGTCGEHVFVETQEEFDQAEAEYQQALQEEGGSPTEC